MSSTPRHIGSTFEEGSLRAPLRWGLLIFTLAPVLVLTLRPAPETSWVGAGLFCVICGHAGTANLVRNVILFVPLGVALALLLGARSRAVVAALAVTAMIEGLQFYIPGRNPGLTDILANVSGAALAVAAVRWSPRWLWLERQAAAALSLGFAVAASATLIGTAFLFSPDLTRTSWFGHLNPDLEHLERYQGEVQSAYVGTTPVRLGSIEDPDRVRNDLLVGEPVEVEAVAGPPPSGLSPLFMITSGARNEMLLVGVHGHDLVARIHYRAVRFGFDRPDLRATGALRGVPPGTRMEVVFTPRGGASCLSLNGREVCGIGPGLERGWALLLYPSGAPAWAKHGFDLLWMMGLFLPFGFFARRHVRSWAGGGMLLLAVGSTWWLGAVAPLSTWGASGVMAGLLLGWTLRKGRWRLGASGRGPTMFRT